VDSDNEGLSDLEEEDINAIHNEDDDFNIEDYLRFKAQLEAEEAKKRDLDPSNSSSDDED